MDILHTHQPSQPKEEGTSHPRSHANHNVYASSILTTGQKRGRQRKPPKPRGGCSNPPMSPIMKFHDFHSLKSADEANEPIIQDVAAATNKSRDLDTNRRQKGNVSIREYYCFMLQIRPGEDTNILRAGRLIQQFEVDQYVKLETSRLDYYRSIKVQWENHVESYQGLVDSAGNDGISLGNSIGNRMLLPSSFIGGPRDMHRRYMNALALLQKYGKPDV